MSNIGRVSIDVGVLSHPASSAIVNAATAKVSNGTQRYLISESKCLAGPPSSEPLTKASKARTKVRAMKECSPWRFSRWPRAAVANEWRHLPGDDTGATGEVDNALTRAGRRAFDQHPRPWFKQRGPEVVLVRLGGCAALLRGHRQSSSREKLHPAFGGAASQPHPAVVAGWAS
jgi:hypothetical protein